MKDKDIINNLNIAQQKFLEKDLGKSVQFFIGADTYDKDNCAYILYRKVGDSVEVINSRQMREIEFIEEVNNVSKYFKAEIEWT